MFWLNSNAFSTWIFGIGRIILAETIVTFPLNLFLSTHDLIKSIKKSANALIYLTKVMHNFERNK